MADERFVVLTEEMVVALLKKYDPLTQSLRTPQGDLVTTTSAKAILKVFEWLSHGRDLGKVKTMPNDE